MANGACGRLELARELFLISVVAIGLGVGYATYLFGLSFAFGAFVAGLVLSQSDYSHQALADVEPLRDVFAMLLRFGRDAPRPGFPHPERGDRGAGGRARLCGQGAVFAGVVRAFGYGNIIPFAVGLGLFQVGEFSFVIARVGVEEEAISRAATPSC